MNNTNEFKKGYYKTEDNLPDKDLGKSITPGFRNVLLEVFIYNLLALCIVICIIILFIFTIIILLMQVLL
jgi:hypothetical protein